MLLAASLVKYALVIVSSFGILKKDFVDYFVGNCLEDDVETSLIAMDVGSAFPFTFVGYLYSLAAMDDEKGNECPNISLRV